MAPSPPSVFVIDDEPDIVNLLTQTLEEHGYVAAGTTDPEVALVEIQSTPSLKLIVSDLMMPKMDGVELIRRACRSRPDLRVLFITGGFHHLRCRRTDRVLPKPIDLNAFQRAVRRSLVEPHPVEPNSDWSGPERRRYWPLAAISPPAG